MLQHSKLLRGREEWKAKAIVRGNENREQRKTIKRYQQRLAELKTENKSLQTALSESFKKNACCRRREVHQLRLN